MKIFVLLPDVETLYEFAEILLPAEEYEDVDLNRRTIKKFRPARYGKAKVPIEFRFKIVVPKEFQGDWTWKIDPKNWADFDSLSQEKVLFCARLSINNTEGYIYRYKGNFYITQIELSPEDATLVLTEELGKPQKRLIAQVERLKAKASRDNNRLPVPENVQIAVWNRDGGKCVVCGSQERLEYDHIIPVSRGGSNTARNIQLLCEKCNRAKGAKIGG